MMSNGVLNAIAREQSKLQRQLDACEATEALLEVLGESVAERSKLVRQQVAVKLTKANIAKLNKAVK